MTRVLGIDPSLTGTGIAVIDDIRHLETGQPVLAVTDTRKTTGRRADPIAAIDLRITDIAGSVMDWADGVTLAVIEGPSIGSRGGSPWDRAGLWWRIVHRLHGLDVPVAVCPPTVRAKWATGKGNADKATVAVAMSRLYPDLPETISNDEWDALALASIGAQHLGLPVPTRAHHAAALHQGRAKVAWPETLEVPA